MVAFVLLSVLLEFAEIGKSRFSGAVISSHRTDESILAHDGFLLRRCTGRPSEEHARRVKDLNGADGAGRREDNEESLAGNSVDLVPGVLSGFLSFISPSVEE